MISKLNPNLALNKLNELLINVNTIQVFYSYTLNIYAYLVCLILFNDLFSDVTILKVLA